MIKFDIKNRFSGEVQFTAEIDCSKDASQSVKIDLAVKWAVNSGANLSGANLSGANLRGANLSGANLSGANLSGAKNADLAIAQTRILPDGELIGWKSCRDNVLVKMKIPTDAKRSHAFGRKCRAEFVDVIEVISGEIGISWHDAKTEYQAGKRVTCDAWCDDWQTECAGGIHFWITREEAENW